MSAISNSYVFEKSIGAATGRAIPGLITAPQGIPPPAAKLLRELVFLHALIHDRRQVAADGVGACRQLPRRRVDHVEQFGKYNFLRRHRRQFVDSLDVDRSEEHTSELQSRQY